MTTDLLDIINEYLLLFPDEKRRQEKLTDYVRMHNSEEITDWNNFDGHIVASGFVYAIKEKKFLLLYHNDLKKFLYPGGHIDKDDDSILKAAIREVREETGLSELEIFKVNGNKIIPLDIDTHIIPYNERLNLPEHYHFDFRYVFLIDKISDIKIDTKEISNYKWVSYEELREERSYGIVIKKIEKLLINTWRSNLIIVL